MKKLLILTILVTLLIPFNTIEAKSKISTPYATVMDTTLVFADPKGKSSQGTEFVLYVKNKGKYEEYESIETYNGESYNFINVRRNGQYAISIRKNGKESSLKKFKVTKSKEKVKLSGEVFDTRRVYSPLHVITDRKGNFHVGFNKKVSNKNVKIKMYTLEKNGKRKYRGTKSIKGNKPHRIDAKFNKTKKSRNFIFTYTIGKKESEYTFLTYDKEGKYIDEEFVSKKGKR
ncbi:hypothetical protein AR9_g065 [Bacillus phage AR9]|uniref:Uncharacterized protein n=1 Tax=Bacillus phage AR9 TaxID=1815509 RepID=A0A172JHX4_BPPB1|nr:hypothetical protein BI022_gp064 [Bacillus phage AR9]AMS01149.1 hypothetical protein AR9_g065 [Bacillus phage AR9]WCS68187.1 hypothetical protein Goe21_00770 [Bacillus phage vB_BsuM-Goe21]